VAFTKPTPSFPVITASFLYQNRKYIAHQTASRETPIMTNRHAVQSFALVAALSLVKNTTVKAEAMIKRELNNTPTNTYHQWISSLRS